MPLKSNTLFKLIYLILNLNLSLSLKLRPVLALASDFYRITLNDKKTLKNIVIDTVTYPFVTKAKLAVLIKPKTKNKYIIIINKQ